MYLCFTRWRGHTFWCGLEWTHPLVWTATDTPLVWVGGDTPSGVGWRGDTFWCGLEWTHLVWTATDTPLVWVGGTHLLVWVGGGHLLVWIGGGTPPGVDFSGAPSGVDWRGDTPWCGLQWTHLSAGMGQCYKPHLECHLLVQLFRGVSELTSGEGHFEKGIKVTVV